MAYQQSPPPLARRSGRLEDPRMGRVGKSQEEIDTGQSRGVRLIKETSDVERNMVDHTDG